MSSKTQKFDNYYCTFFIKTSDFISWGKKTVRRAKWEIFLKTGLIFVQLWTYLIVPCTNSAVEISFPMKTFILARELELARNEVQFIFILKILFIFRGEGREKESKRNIEVCNPDMCPDWELNQWSFSSQAGTHSTEPHQPGQWVLTAVPFPS